MPLTLRGFKFDQLNKIIQCYENQINHSGIYGIYEYNPLFDSLGNKDGKKIAWSINQILKRVEKVKKPSDKIAELSKRQN